MMSNNNSSNNKTEQKTTCTQTCQVIVTATFKNAHNNEPQESTEQEDNHEESVNVNENVIIRYPFREMDMTWWDQYLDTIPEQERVLVIIRVMDCLMAHALLHEDPFVEGAVLQMHKHLPKEWPHHISHELLNYFQVGHHIFKTICVMAKYPTVDNPERKRLLTMMETRIKEVDNAAKKKTILQSQNVSAAAHVALNRLHRLRKENESRTAYHDVMDAFKLLFFTVSTRNGVVPEFKPNVNPFNTYVCCEGCQCYAKLRTTYTVYVREVEKAKVMDCIMIAAIKLNDVFMHDIVSELLANHFRDYMENPLLDDIARHVQNGPLFFCRTALFDSLNIIHYVSQLHREALPIHHTDSNSGFERIITSLLWIKEQVKDIRVLNSLVPLIHDTMSSVEHAYAQLGQSNCLQSIHTIKEYMLQLFNALSASEYHLTVHSHDPFVGKPADMKCANVHCPGTLKELLKCSGCDVTYYCCAECQKMDWERHKNFCHELEMRRGRPVPVKTSMTPTTTIKSRM